MYICMGYINTHGLYQQKEYASIEFKPPFTRYIMYINV